jgi:hypothetical protein
MPINQRTSDWLRLSETINLIMEVGRCDRDSALSQIRAKLGAGKLACHWRRVHLSELDKKTGQAPFSDEFVPNDLAFWEAVHIGKGGLVSLPLKYDGPLVGHPAFYPNIGKLTQLVLELAKGNKADRKRISSLREEVRKRVTRRLYLSRENVQNHWPSITASQETKTAVISKPRIREAIKRVIRKQARSPNINEATTLVKHELPEAARWRIREVLKEPEFAERRRKPGRPPGKLNLPKK